MANGNVATIVPTHAELTTQQASNALSLSRPFLVQLLASDAIHYRRVGTQRRVRFADLMEDKRRDEAHRQSVMDHLTTEAQKHGLGSGSTGTNPGADDAGSDRLPWHHQFAARHVYELPNFHTRWA